MAVTTVLFWVTIVLSVIGSNATGEFTIVHSPKSLSFTGSSTVSESALKEIFSASLGLSVEEDLKWYCLKIVDPFKTPEAVVEVYIDGVESLGNAANLKGNRYQLTIDEYEPDTYDAIAHRIKQRFVGDSNNLVHIKLSNSRELSDFQVSHDPTILKTGKQTYKHLKHHVEEDKKFLIELQALREVAKRVESSITSDNAIDFYNFRFRSLHALSDFHGPNSLQTKEAKKLLAEELENLSAAFVKAYDGSVLVTVVTTDVAHTRRATRSLREMRATTTDAGKDFYPEDYAAIFNILLWFGITFVFVLIAIVYAMVDMDPGRDSIIYRMTSTRMKKDN